MSATEIMAEREVILKLLPQTTQENITKDFKNMSIIPTSRYPNLPKHLYSTMQVGHLYNSDKPENSDVPRFSLPSFKEVISRAQLKRAGGGGSLAINTRIQGGESQESLMRVQQSCDANANDFYQAMREKRKIERENNGGGQQQEDRRGSKTTLQLEAYEAGTKRNAPLQTSSTTKDPGLSYQNAPGATLKEKIALRRAALEKENREKELEEQKGDQKTILNDIASKAEFVRKMSQTFGYGMPSNAEAKPDTLTAEAEKCPLLIKSSNNRNSPRENNRKNAENLLIKKDEPKQERVKEEKKKEEKKKEEKKKDKSKAEARKERTREKKAAGGGGGAKPLSMQQLITQNLPASRERMVRNSDIERSPKPSLHSSVAPVNPGLDIEIDPELDMMLAELELDEDFSSLGENEQKAWLESLFFMDTKHNPGRQPRDQLSKTKVQKKNTLREPDGQSKSNL